MSEDFTKSKTIHWYHDPNTGSTLTVGREVASIKPPLEKRLWFSYWNQPPSGYTGGYPDQPRNVARLLDSGASQSVSLQQISVQPFTWVPQLVTDPVGRSTTFAYAANHNDLLTVKQNSNTIATYGSYNTQHEPQTYTGADSKTWNYTYQTNGQLHTVTDPNAGVTTYNYDASNRLSTIVNANSQTVLTLTYDADDRVQTRTDSQGYTLTYAYDNLDRVTSITYPDSTTDLFDYNFQSGPYVGTPSMELRKYTDRLGRVTTYGYDADQRLTSVTEPLTSSTTRTTSYSYYENGKLKEITDAKGNITHWDIDIEGRPIDKIYAYGTSSAKTETYTYENSTSRLKSVTDALGQVKTFSYDADDEVTGITYTSTINPTPNVTFMPDQLDAVRDVLDATTGNLVQSYDYTPYGAVTRSNGSTATDYQYAELFSHPISSLNLSMTRPFDPATGRWLNKDPMGEAGGVNLYSYGANPVSGFDPLGLSKLRTPLQGYRIDLLEEETNGGHTIAEHVGKSSEYLWLRLLAANNDGWHLERASSFCSLQSATKLVNSALSQNSAVVALVANGTLKEALVGSSFLSSTGYEVLYPSGEQRTTFGVGVVIRHNPESANGFSVVSAWPGTIDK